MRLISKVKTGLVLEAPNLKLGRGLLCCDFFSDFRALQSLVAAGYVLYSASTELVLTFGKGVVGFTLDTSRLAQLSCLRQKSVGGVMIGCHFVPFITGARARFPKALGSSS